MRHEIIHTLTIILLKFKLHWTTLQSVMKTTGTVISGSAALAVLFRGEFMPQDLDFYVNKKGFTTMLLFLMDQNYQVTTSRPYYKSQKRNTKSTTILTLKYKNENMKIDLITTNEEHVLDTITQFHSTVVMNYIAFYGIVCLYPDWTLQKNGLTTGENIPSKILNKYRLRGFKMASTSSELTGYDNNHECGRHICCPKFKRSLQDRFNLFISFEEGITDIFNCQWALKNIKECPKIKN